ncbi:MAG TPA: glycosyltransferase [Isosphaeraceae bacterium]|nr:glycosyltransferase [Isosphaeraceae bacterium]
MDASDRVGEARARLGAGRSESKSTLPTAHAFGDAAAGPPLAGLRVALVHDWLTGMRGGEKCLEVLCRAFPSATLYTLIHRRGALSPAIESMAIRTSPMQRIPGVFRHYRHLLPIMPLAARAWRPRDVDLVVSLSHCVAKAVVPPKGVPHVCYCFTPMRYAWQARETYLGGWSGRPLQRVLARTILSRLRRWDRATAGRVSHFVAISETVRGRIARCYRRHSRVIPPPVDVAYYTPDPSGRPRGDAYLVVSALVPYKRIDQAVMACTQSGRRLIVIGDGPERARLEATAGPTVLFLGWQPDDVIRNHYRHCRALLFPGEEDFGIVPVEALACGAPVLALGRGGAAETVDDAVGRTYPEPTAAGLLRALDAWESQGCPADPSRARRRAEAFALPLFRQRLLGFLAEVVAGTTGHPTPPAPHLDLA